MSHSTKRVLSLLGASAAILSALTVSPLLANDLFYTISEGGSDLIEINVRSVGTTTTTLIGPTSGGFCITLALSPWGTLYSMCGPLFGTQHLATIDRGTGLATVFGTGVSGLAVMAMKFGPDGNLYAIGGCYPSGGECAGPNSLYKVDTGSGAFTLVGPTGTPLFFMDLALDHSGNMYGVTSTLSPSGGPPARLYRINLTTGAATKVVDLVGSTSIMGLSFDQEKNKLYATDFYSINSALYVVDLKTGFLTPVATTGYGHSSNLVPVPGTN